MSAPLKPGQNPPWGLIEPDSFDAYSDDVILVRREYLHWIASALNETCNCARHLDHMDCLAEIENFINYFDGKADKFQADHS